MCCRCQQSPAGNAETALTGNCDHFARADSRMRQPRPIIRSQPTGQAAQGLPANNQELAMTLVIDFQRLTMLGFVAIASGFVGCASLGEKATPKLTAQVTPGEGAAAAPP